MKREFYNKSIKALNNLVVRLYSGDNSTTYNEQFNQALALITKEKVVEVHNTVCTAGLMSNRSNIGKDLVGIVSLHSYQRNVDALSQEQKEMFCDWFLKRSPYAKCISTKSVKTMLEKGIVADPSYPANLIVGALIAQRVLWEYTEVVYRMCDFINAGMNENAAFCLAHKFMVSGDSVVPSEYSGHCAIDGGRIHEEYLSNFIHSRTVGALAPYSELLHYDNIHALWGYAGYSMHDDMSVENGIHKFDDAGKGVEVIIPNPFFATFQLNNKKAISLASCVKYANSL